MGSQIWAVFVLSRHLQAHTTHNMNAYKLLLIVAVGAASGARQLRGMKDRDQRSLVNTFPFNAADGGHHGDHHAHGDDHGHHGDHAARAPSQDLGARAQLRELLTAPLASMMLPE